MYKIIIFHVFFFLTAQSGPNNLINDLKFYKALIIKQQKKFLSNNYHNIHLVKKVVNKMYITHQEARKLFAKNLDNSKVMKILLSMAEIYTKEIKRVLMIHKWLNISKFGKETDRQAWLLIQHADHDPFFQAGCFFVLNKLAEQDETAKENIPFLYDGVSLKFQELGMKQKFGTQIEIFKDHLEILPFEGTLQDVDNLRQSLGLIPLSEYLKEIKKMYIKN